MGFDSPNIFIKTIPELPLSVPDAYGLGLHNIKTTVCSEMHSPYKVLVSGKIF